MVTSIPSFPIIASSTQFHNSQKPNNHPQDNRFPQEYVNNMPKASKSAAHIILKDTDQSQPKRQKLGSKTTPLDSNGSDEVDEDDQAEDMFHDTKEQLGEQQPHLLDIEVIRDNDEEDEDDDEMGEEYDDEDERDYDEDGSDNEDASDNDNISDNESSQGEEDQEIDVEQPDQNIDNELMQTITQQQEQNIVGSPTKILKDKLKRPLQPGYQNIFDVLCQQPEQRQQVQNGSNGDDVITVDDSDEDLSNNNNNNNVVSITVTHSQEIYGEERVTKKLLDLTPSQQILSNAPSSLSSATTITTTTTTTTAATTITLPVVDTVRINPDVLVIVEMLSSSVQLVCDSIDI